MLLALDPLLEGRLLWTPLLIVFGGLGFPVVRDLVDRVRGGVRGRARAVRLQTRVVLYVSGLLILAGTLLFYVVERDGRFGLKIGVKKGGCAGMEYTMDYVDEIAPHDEVVEDGDARVMIAPMAQMFLFGTQIDYEVSLLESGFKFNNPNVQNECGCGESFNI